MRFVEVCKQCGEIVEPEMPKDPWFVIVQCNNCGSEETESVDMYTLTKEGE